MVERVALLVDGSNFYHRLRELGLSDLLRFDYERFSHWLAGSRPVVSRAYYIGAIREERGSERSRTLMANQQRLLSRLQACGWNVRLGHMLKADNAYHEKGVDVLMAVDLLAGAYQGTYDAAVLLSSDTDLIPVLDHVRARGKRVEYIGFSHKPSYGLIKHSDLRKLLAQDDVARFLPDSNA